MGTNTADDPRGSEMVLLMKQLYTDPNPHLDFTYGYPERINPDWIKALQTNVPAAVFSDESSTRKYVRIVEDYFLNLLQAPNISLAPTAGYAIVHMCDALIRKPGDEIILQDVSFEPYPKLIETFKGKAITVARNADFSMNVQNIKNAYTKNTKAIIIVNPDNPTGLIYSEAAMKELVAFCVEKDVTLAVDYTFFQISPFGKKVPLFTTFPESKRLSYMIIGDTGKILGLKGSKFGALLYSDNWKECIDEVVSNYLFQHEQYNLYLFSSIFADKRFEDYLQYLNATIAENYQYIKDNLHQSLKLLPMDATVFCLIDITATGISDKTFASTLLSKGIGTIPITFFYKNNNDSPGNAIRIALSRPLEEIRQIVKVANKVAASAD